MTAPVISATLVKELRDQTGAGMMDAKRALVDAGGDIEAARTLLRERGMASAAKREGRETSEGLVGYRISDGHATMVAVGCETEPVSKNSEFQDFAKKVLDAVDADGVARGRRARRGAAGADRQARREHRRRCRRRASRRSTAACSRATSIRRRTSSACSCSSAAATRTSRASSRCTLPRRARSGSRATTSPRDRRRREEIYANTDEVLSKPEQAREKIVEGMLNKRFFAANVLNEQPWIHDTTKTVGQALADEGAEALEFERFALAG